jgi:plasmid stabilization system protein ParE
MIAMRNAHTSIMLENIWKRAFEPESGTRLSRLTVDFLLHCDKELKGRSLPIIVYTEDFGRCLEELMDGHKPEPWIADARKIVDACLALSDHPEAGILCPDIAPDCYELRVDNYLIYYHYPPFDPDDPYSQDRLILVTLESEYPYEIMLEALPAPPQGLIGKVKTLIGLDHSPCS